MKIIKNRNSPVKNQYEQIAWDQNRLVVGVDEVGRGCLAGPLVTASCILEPYTKHELIKDSKMLTRKELLEVYSWLTRHSSWSVSIVHSRLIDSLNIYRATQLAMKRSIIQLLSQQLAYKKSEIQFLSQDTAPYAILIDAVPINLRSITIPVYSFNYGESLSDSIAAASIIAKVIRDNLIERLDSTIPGYNLAQHKGYGTEDHTHLVSTLGPSIVHRNTFIPARNLAPEKQVSLFESSAP